MRCACVAGFLALMMAACGGEPAPRPEAAEASAPAFRNVAQGAAEFVGDAACADCHEDDWRGYQSHGMARSFYPMTPENAVEEFPAGPIRDEASGFSYRVFEEDGAYFQEEYRQDGAGTHRLVRRMDYVVGSGTAARTYLTESQGRLYELPLTWYTQARRWDFSPGYRTHNVRFDRLIPDRCMACHNSYPASVPFVEGKYTEVPQGIGCERCHGPGSLHVEARLASPEPEAEIDDTIVNPAHLPLDRQLDVCQQCHLHGTVSVLRDGRGPFDFRPSEPLAAHVALFGSDTPRDEDQIEVISHADRMKQSACFVATAATEAAMTCVTCHDPHEGFRDQGPGYFDATCQDCHALEPLRARLPETALATHTADANCSGCHMPEVEAEDAPHSSFTDHWIRVVEDRPAPPAAPSARATPTLVPYFEQDRQGPRGKLYEGMAYVILGRQQADTATLEKGAALLEEATAADTTLGDAFMLLGVAHTLLGAPSRAVPAFEAAVREDPDVPERLNALAQAYQAVGRDPIRIERLYGRALDLQPARADIRVNYGQFLERQQRFAEAIEQYRRAAAEQPWLAVTHFDLGTAYLRQGAAEEAEAALQEALALDPDYPAALGNLGMLYASQGRPALARQHFEHAAAVAPDDPTALGNLGAFYLNEGQPRRAIDVLEHAVTINPNYLDGLANLALAHYQNNDAAQARRYAEATLRNNPNHPTARQILHVLNGN